MDKAAKKRNVSELWAIKHFPRVGVSLRVHIIVASAEVLIINEGNPCFRRGFSRAETRGFEPPALR